MCGVVCVVYRVRPVRSTWPWSWMTLIGGMIRRPARTLEMVVVLDDPDQLDDPAFNPPGCRQFLIDLPGYRAFFTLPSAHALGLGGLVPDQDNLTHMIRRLP
jgi:hypothetical protein